MQGYEDYWNSAFNVKYFKQTNYKIPNSEAKERAEKIYDEVIPHFLCCVHSCVAVIAFCICKRCYNFTHMFLGVYIYIYHSLNATVE